MVHKLEVTSVYETTKTHPEKNVNAKAVKIINFVLRTVFLVSFESYFINEKERQNTRNIRLLSVSFVSNTCTTTNWKIQFSYCFFFFLDAIIYTYLELYLSCEQKLFSFNFIINKVLDKGRHLLPEEVVFYTPR